MPDKYARYRRRLIAQGICQQCCRRPARIGKPTCATCVEAKRVRHKAAHVPVLLSIHVTEAFKGRIKALADSEARTISSVAREMLETYVAELDEGR